MARPAPTTLTVPAAVAPPSLWSVWDYGSTIALRGDGLHALPWWGQDQTGDEQAFVTLWANTTNDAVSYPEPWAFVFEPTVVFYGDSLFMSDLVGHTGPVEITESTINPFQVITITNIGTADNRSPTLVALSNGVAMVSYRMNTSQIVLDMAYRSFIPPFAQSPWWTNTFSFQPDQGTIPSSVLAAVQGPDGNLWVFGSRDSSGRIYLGRFRESGNTLALVDFNSKFFSNEEVNGVPLDGAMSPHGELPFVEAVADFAGGRVLLSYESLSFNTWCNNYLAVPVIVAVSNNLSKGLICQCPDFVERIQPVPIIVQPGAVDYILQPKPQDCSAQPFQFRTFHGSFDPRQKLSCTETPAVCQDGCAFVYDPVNGFRFDRLPVPPVLSIGKSALWWTPNTPGFALESASAINGKWSAVKNAGNPMAANPGFYRLRKPL